MANRSLGLIMVLLLVGFSMSAKAAVTPLYETTLSCQSQGESERQALFKQGLIQVLEKVSGESGFERDEKVKRAQERITDYVEQYAYQGNELNVRFSADLINRLMNQSGRAMWGQRRPNVILWLAVEESNQERRLVGAETDPTLQSQLEKWASEKGLPLLLPLMDLEDVSNVSVTDVWGQFSTTLQQASKRYDAQIILVAKLIHNPAAVDGKPWVANWQMLTATETPSWSVTGQTQEEVLMQGIASTSHYLMGRFGQKSNSFSATSDKPFFIGVDNVQNGNDYTNVEKYLMNLAPANAVNIRRIDGLLAVFEITPRDGNGREAFLQALQFERHFPRMQDEVTSEVDLIVRWTP
ncbi:DUF2066 domain-containing protein [Candidatus Berkiella aquae]|uniref:DUF2066 domain-containing protein n=1 Tax=Candidatus Berkiella aquae TaxID=295108 RepID=A0A0Q9YV95_9GAMM|nr:DUF2066 domain-containing protein [Candidatus Berkiella aquae]MCS5710970.1 DUF2066 domain-containing protein [Candidatus Berkiella aquae]